MWWTEGNRQMKRFQGLMVKTRDWKKAIEAAQCRRPFDLKSMLCNGHSIFFCRLNPKKNSVARIPIGPCSSLFKQKMQTQKAIYYILLSHKTTDIGRRIILQIYVNLDSMNMKRLCWFRLMPKTVKTSIESERMVCGAHRQMKKSSTFVRGAKARSCHG